MAVKKVADGVFGGSATNERPVDLLIGNAGLGYVSEIADQTNEQFERA